MSKKIFFAYLAPESMVNFVKKDYEILKKYYIVRTYCYKGWKRGLLDIPKILYGVLTTDVNISWFAYVQSYYAVIFSKIFRKKSIVIIGGFDVAEEETHNKRIHPKIKKQLKYSLNNANILLAISERIKNKAMQYTKRSDIKVIYHGFDYETFKCGCEKEDLVVTIGYVKKGNLWRKGHETFVKAAKYLPEVRFVLIGKHLDDSIDYLKNIATPNVEFTGWVSDEKLLDYMQRAKVYVQVSFHEGFGLSLAEAMLCECVPVVTDRGALPEVVGDTGYYVPFRDPEATAEAIKKALEGVDPDLGKKARERIKTLFPLEKREKELIDAVEGLIAN